MDYHPPRPHRTRAILFELSIILGLVLLNGLFSGAEIAMVSVRQTRVQQLLEEGRGDARALAELRRVPERFLATVQVGITLVGASAAAFGGASVTARLQPVLAELPYVARFAQPLAFGLVVGGISFLSIVLGELVPKSLALRAAEGYALRVARPMTWLSTLARPLVWLLTATSNLLLRPFGDKTNFTESRLSSDELQLLIEEAQKANVLDVTSSQIAVRALNFEHLTAADVMIPRNRVHALPRDSDEAEIRRVILEEGHARMPVYDGSLDRIVGYIVTREVLGLIWEKGLFVLDDLVRPPLFVPHATPATRLLRQMQSRRIPLALVVDEYGGLAGLVTEEDLLEELVGELFSEDEKPVELVKPHPDGGHVVAGDATIRDVNRALDLSLDEEEEGATTVGGLVVARAQRIPVAGARIELEGGVVLEVLEATPQRVKRIRIIPPPTPAETPPEEEEGEEEGEEEDDAAPGARGDGEDDSPR